jgi:hypothetical protein
MAMTTIKWEKLDTADRIFAETFKKVELEVRIPTGKMGKK